MARIKERVSCVLGLCAAAWVAAACSDLADPMVPVTAQFGVEEPPPPPPKAASGRMTGGGFQIENGVRITRGLTLHCDVLLSNNLEINWDGGNQWHLEKESLEEVACIDDPAYEPTPPAAPFDTFIARAVGRLNHVDGSVITFRFIDDGEPGTSDEAHFTIYAPNQGPGQVAEADQVVVLAVSGPLDGGNLQAHYDQPHGSLPNAQ